MLFLAAPPAQAASPIEIGPGRNAHVALDAAGTAYIAWIGTGPDPTPLFFCRLPRNATACAVKQQIAIPGTSLTRPFVLVDGLDVRVISYRYGLGEPVFDAVYLMRSVDGGVTFDAGTQIGVLAFHDAIRGPSDSVSLIADNSSRFQNVRTVSGARDTASADLAPAYPYSPSIAMTSPSTTLAVFTNGASEAQYRVHSGTASPNDPATWSTAATFAAYAGYPRLATGPLGTFVASDNAAGHLEVRPFTGDQVGFGAPAGIPGPAREASGGAYDLTQDGLGRLHLIWPQSDENGFHVGYSTSDDGAAWQAARFDVADPRDLARIPYAMRLAVGADHLGYAVWDNGGSAGKVFALPVGPDANAFGPPAPLPSPMPSASPVPSPSPSPTPVAGRSATIAPVSGRVLVKPPGAKEFVSLLALSSVPVGSTVDTREGRARLTSADPKGATQTADFYEGRFRIEQKASAGATTDLVLGGGSFARCPRRGGRRASAAKARTVRRLWGSGKGRFRTRGKHASATVRGTVWLTEDRCDGTWFRVRQGSVTVTDSRGRGRKIVRAGRTRHVSPRR